MAVEVKTIELTQVFNKELRKPLSRLDIAFLEDIMNILKKLGINAKSTSMRNRIRKFRNSSFPAYLLFGELNGLLLDKVLKKVDNITKNIPCDIALMQLFILDPLHFSERYLELFKKSIQDFSFSLLNAPKNVFWCWADAYDFTTRKTFKIISSHSEGLTKTEIIQVVNETDSKIKILKQLRKNSSLKKYNFIILQSGRYYPFFSDQLNKQSLLKARKELRKQVEFTKNLLALEYKMQKYHADVILKFLKGAKSLTSILGSLSDENLEVSNPKIVRALLRTRKTGLSKYMISRMEERFIALQSDGLLQVEKGSYFITDIAKNLIGKGFIIFGSHYADILLFEERIVKKGHNYWNVRKYLDFMMDLRLIESADYPNLPVYKLTQTGLGVLREGVSPHLLIKR